MRVRSGVREDVWVRWEGEERSVRVKKWDVRMRIVRVGSGVRG